MNNHPGGNDLAFFHTVVQVNLVGTFNVMTLAAGEDRCHRGRRRRCPCVVINAASFAAFDGQVG